MRDKIKQRENRRKYYLSHKDYFREYNRKYRKEHPDSVLRHRKKQRESGYTFAHNKEYRLKNRDRLLKKSREYYLENKDKFRSYRENKKVDNRNKVNENTRKYRRTERGRIVRRNIEDKYRKIHPERHEASKLIRNLVKSKIIIKPSNCSKCNMECLTEGHHNDYSKPLEVIWVCHSCHMLIHNRLRSKNNITAFKS